MENNYLEEQNAFRKAFIKNKYGSTTESMKEENMKQTKKQTIEYQKEQRLKDYKYNAFNKSSYAKIEDYENRVYITEIHPLTLSNKMRDNAKYVIYMKILKDLVDEETSTAIKIAKKYHTEMDFIQFTGGVIDRQNYVYKGWKGWKNIPMFINDLHTAFNKMENVPYEKQGQYIKEIMVENLEKAFESNWESMVEKVRANGLQKSKSVNVSAMNQIYYGRISRMREEMLKEIYVYKGIQSFLVGFWGEKVVEEIILRDYIKNDTVKYLEETKQMDRDGYDKILEFTKGDITKKVGISIKYGTKNYLTSLDSWTDSKLKHIDTMKKNKSKYDISYNMIYSLSIHEDSPVLTRGFIIKEQ